MNLGYWVSIILVSAMLIGCSDSQVHYQKNHKYLEIITQIEKNNLYNSIIELTDYKTRYPHGKQIKVANYLYSKLSKHGLDTSFHEYEYWGVKWKNVVSVLQGTERPDETIIVCAHMDSKSDQRLVFAPGADDNASGCSAILELARIFKNQSFKRTVKFVIFSREETGRQGSKAYVQNLKEKGEEVKAVFNLDMIAYGNKDEDIDLMAQPVYSYLVDKAAAVATAYGYKIKRNVGDECY